MHAVILPKVDAKRTAAPRGRKNGTCSWPQFLQALMLGKEHREGPALQAAAGPGRGGCVGGGQSAPIDAHPSPAVVFSPATNASCNNRIPCCPCQTPTKANRCQHQGPTAHHLPTPPSATFNAATHGAPDKPDCTSQQTSH